MSGELSSGHKHLHLSEVKQGTLVRVVRISRDAQCRHRLLGMGIAPGVLIRVERAGSAGSLIIEVQGKKFLLGDGLPCQVAVAPVEE